MTASYTRPRRGQTRPQLGGLALGSALLLGGCAVEPYPDYPPVVHRPASAYKGYSALPAPIHRKAPGELEDGGTDMGQDDASLAAEGTPGQVTGQTPPQSPSVAPAAPAAAPAAAERQKVQPEAWRGDPAAYIGPPRSDQRSLTIRLNDQRFEYREGGAVVHAGEVSSGSAEHPTPAGSYRVLSKEEDKRSRSYTNGFDQPTPMPYALQFKGPYYIHEGWVPGQQRAESHGCVRLHYEDARFVYERIRVGDPIRIVN